MKYLISHLPTGSKYFKDVPNINSEWLKLIESEGMVPLWSATRMYTKDLPRSVDWTGVYAISSLELG